jgi:hypothetical protein
LRAPIRSRPRPLVRPFARSAHHKEKKEKPQRQDGTQRNGNL